MEEVEAWEQQDGAEWGCVNCGVMFDKGNYKPLGCDPGAANCEDTPFPR